MENLIFQFPTIFSNVELYMDRTIHIFSYVELNMDRTAYRFWYVELCTDRTFFFNVSNMDNVWIVRSI